MALVQPKDTTLTKIFVGGLPYHTTDETLRKYFEQFGELEEAVVITDRQTSKSRGYGFVTMTDKMAAGSACKDPNPIIDGRKANVNLAYIGAKPRIPTSDLMLAYSAFPFALKTGLPLGYVGTHMSSTGIPQLVYAPAYPQYTTGAPNGGALQVMAATPTLLPAGGVPGFYDYTPTTPAALATPPTTSTSAPARGYSLPALETVGGGSYSPHYFQTAAGPNYVQPYYPHLMNPTSGSGTAFGYTTTMQGNSILQPTSYLPTSFSASATLYSPSYHQQQLLRPKLQ